MRGIPLSKPRRQRLWRGAAPLRSRVLQAQETKPLAEKVTDGLIIQSAPPKENDMPLGAVLRESRCAPIVAENDAAAAADALPVEAPVCEDKDEIQLALAWACGIRGASNEHLTSKNVKFPCFGKPEPE